MRVRVPVMAMAILALATFAGCGGGGAPTAAPSAAPSGAPSAAPSAAPTAAPTQGIAAIECDAAGSGTAVDIAGFSFAPSSASVAVGGMATWSNQDGTSHTVSFDGGPNCGTVASGANETVLFSVAGTYPYHCQIHPDMTGTVVVE